MAGTPTKKTKPAPAKPRASAAKAKAPSAAKANAAAPVAAKAEGKEKASVLRLKDFIDSIVAETKGNKKAIKETTELVLAKLGAALEKGSDLNLTGFGRAKVVKTADKGGVSVLTIKLKRGSQKNAQEGKESLAQAGEDS